MTNSQPHFLLFTHVEYTGNSANWSFTLQPMDGSAPIQVSDVEHHPSKERLELQVLVWALEALDQATHVCLVSNQSNIRRAVRGGMEEWKANQWCWEYYGEMCPIANADLWRRLDRLMNIHQLECRQWRMDAAHSQDDSQLLEESTEMLEESQKPSRGFWGGITSNLMNRIQRGSKELFQLDRDPSISTVFGNSL